MNHASALRNDHPIVEKIASHLNHLGLRSGSKLPAERELARELGITRSLLRTGLERLEADGLIWRHVGKGTFIGQQQRAGQAGPSIDFENVMNPHDLMEVRVFLEPPAVALATMRATPDELDEIRNCFDNTLRARSLVEYEHWDGKFHRAIIRSAKNMLLIKVSELFESARDDRVWGKLKEISSTPERRKHYTKQHQDVLRAMLERRSGDAEEIMRAHLRDVQRDLIRASGGNVA
jgi:DNA-binding FadR family transcriptional regulator